MAKPKQTSILSFSENRSSVTSRVSAGIVGQMVLWVNLINFSDFPCADLVISNTLMDEIIPAHLTYITWFYVPAYSNTLIIDLINYLKRLYSLYFAWEAEKLSLVTWMGINISGKC